MAAVRPEFRGDELAFDPADPVFGGPRLPGGRLPPDGPGGQGLCDGHRKRWTAQGRPGDLDGFTAATSPRWLGRGAACLLPGTWLRPRHPGPGTVPAPLPCVGACRTPGMRRVAGRRPG